MGGLTGRFLTRDPIGFVSQDWNAYRFIRRRTLSRLDFNGLADTTIPHNSNRNCESCERMKPKTLEVVPTNPGPNKTCTVAFSFIDVIEHELVHARDLCNDFPFPNGTSECDKCKILERRACKRECERQNPGNPEKANECIEIGAKNSCIDKCVPRNES